MNTLGNEIVRNDADNTAAMPPRRSVRMAHMILDMGFGGAERLVHDIAISLQDDGVSPCVICFDAVTGNTEPLTRRNIPVELIKRSPTAFDAAACIRVVRRLKDLGVQLVHAHDMASMVYAVAAGVLLRIPVVVTEHSRHYIDERWLRRLEKRLFCLGVTTLVEVSPELAQASVQREEVAQDKVVVIENGVDVARFASADPRPIRAELGLAPGIPLLGMVGRLEAIKGPDVLLEAFASLAMESLQAQLVFVGDGSLRQGLSARADALGLEDRVRFLGVREDIPAIMAGLDVLVLPSLSEGLPFALLEGMAAGKAVVASAVGRIPAIISDGGVEGGVEGRRRSSRENGLLVPPGDAAPLTRALSALIRDEPRRLAMGRAARDGVASRYGKDTMLAAYATVYGRALGKGERP